LEPFAPGTKRKLRRATLVSAGHYDLRLAVVGRRVENFLVCATFADAEIGQTHVSAERRATQSDDYD
jgi:hypothetical protein